ncbi:hypothetical protein HS088_TW0G00024 [Tripterygium wilfordii]|uniref:Uncharacterized protein n=1 Tax=Tripterygium wilfordii TaxID=458696 RepID=A0A7J7BSV9_TRIWF|nr:hypothetical protein HS088_TW0G00024 [Tripterygium wilfordii]
MGGEASDVSGKNYNKAATGMPSFVPLAASHIGLFFRWGLIALEALDPNFGTTTILKTICSARAALTNSAQPPKGRARTSVDRGGGGSGRHLRFLIMRIPIRNHFDQCTNYSHGALYTSTTVDFYDVPHVHHEPTIDLSEAKLRCYGTFA